jgi:DNA repair protein RadC
MLNHKVSHVKESPQSPQPTLSTLSTQSTPAPQLSHATQATQIKSPECVLPLLRRWQNRRQENFLAITLNGSHHVIKIHHITKGLANRTIVHPRECFYPAIKDYAVSVIFVHNHPSGSAISSPEDDEITERLCMTAEILGINMLDHIIITPKNGLYSYRREGRLPIKHEGYALKKFAKSLGNVCAERSILPKEERTPKSNKEYVVRGCVELTEYSKRKGKIIIENLIKNVPNDEAEFFGVYEVQDEDGSPIEHWIADFLCYDDAKMFALEKKSNLNAR